MMAGSECAFCFKGSDMGAPRFVFVPMPLCRENSFRGGGEHVKLLHLSKQRNIYLVMDDGPHKTEGRRRWLKSMKDLAEDDLLPRHDRDPTPAKSPEQRLGNDLCMIASSALSKVSTAIYAEYSSASREIQGLLSSEPLLRLTTRDNARYYGSCVKLFQAIAPLIAVIAISALCGLTIVTVARATENSGVCARPPTVDKFDTKLASLQSLDENQFIDYLHKFRFVPNGMTADSVDTSKIYAIGLSMMTPVDIAWTLGFEKAQNIILQVFLSSLYQMDTPKNLRRKFGRVTPSQGPDTNYWWYTLSSQQISHSINGESVELDPTIATINNLHCVQYGHLLTHTVRLVCQKTLATGATLNDTEREFVTLIFERYIKQYIASYWDHRGTGWFTDTARHALEIRLGKRSFTWPTPCPSYYHTTTDAADMIAAALHNAICCIPVYREQCGGSFSSTMQRDFMELATMHQMFMAYRLSNPLPSNRNFPTPSVNGFPIDQGMFADHPEYAYAGWTEERAPARTSRISNTSYDTGHGARWGAILDDFRSAWPVNSANHGYYSELQVALAKLICKTTTSYTASGVPRCSTYLDGSNGWYRFNYNRQGYGQGPWRSAIDVTNLLQYNRGLIMLVCALKKMAHSTEPAVIADRIKLYGMTLDYAGHGTQDAFLSPRFDGFFTIAMQEAMVVHLYPEMSCTQTIIMDSEN